MCGLRSVWRKIIYPENVLVENFLAEIKADYGGRVGC